MLDFWIDLPAWLRMLVALGLIALGVAIVWAGYADAFDTGRRRIPYLGISLAVVGFVLVFVGGKTNAEKNGYRF